MKPVRRLCARSTAIVMMIPLQVLAVASDPGVDMFERGSYVAKIAGCNDCHTAGYARSGGRMPGRDGLQGDALG
jgi:hypothetical protein